MMATPSVNNSGFKSLVGRRVTKNVKFMGEDVKINKLMVSEVLAIQKKARELDKDDTEGLEIVKLVIRLGAEGASDLSDEDFNNFPIDELGKLSDEIMKHSGLAKEAGK
jgi:hypothetical protein